MLLTTEERLRLAFEEDLPKGDLTTDSLFNEPKLGRARLVAKEDLVLSGTGVFEKAVRLQVPGVTLKWQFKDGDWVLDRQTVCLIEGDLVALLRAERVALNFMGPLCGIATLTRCFVNQVKHTDCKILDTRKTRPLYRDLEKAAVRDGGAQNHRMNLSDAVLVKENHVRAVGSIDAAVEQIRFRTTARLEVECSTLEEVETCLRLRVPRILLDNMTNETMAKAVSLVGLKAELEASGNMSLERVGTVAELGVTYISVGALTHSAPTADLSLLFDW